MCLSNVRCVMRNAKKFQNIKGVARQKGLGLPSALFLILVMVLIVGAINQLNEMNAAAYGREWLSMRAFYAAETGAQLSAVYQLSSEAAPACNSGFIDNLNLTAAGLSECRVDVDCVTQNPSDGLTYYTLTSTGICGAGPDEATRVVQVRFSQ